MDLENAHLARRNGKYKKAIELYKQATIEEPNNALAYAGLGLTHAYLNENDHAIAMATKALQLDPNQPLAHITFAGIHHSKGQLEEYKEEVEKAFALDPFFYEVACMYAKMLFSDKKIDEAFPIFEKIIESNPQKVCPHYFMGLAYSYKKQHRKAFNEYIKAFQVLPSLSIALCIFSALINIYWPWSNIFLVTIFMFWYLSTLISRIGAVTFGAFSLLLLLMGGIQKIQEGKRGWGIFYFTTLVILIWHFYTYHLFIFSTQK